MEDCSQESGGEGGEAGEGDDFGLPLVYHDQRYCGIASGMGRTKGNKVVEEEDGGAR